MTANADMTPTVGDRRHLPECDTPHNGLLPCICESLRACEQRVRYERHWMADWTAGNKQGWADALDAAREAVWKSIRPGSDAFSQLVLANALAAIDALRGES